jgi:hypothetical protein
MEPLARILIIAGLIFLGLGLLLYAGFSIPLLGRLPGDMHIERPNLRVYVPITSSVLVSLLLALVLWLIARIR